MSKPRSLRRQRFPDRRPCRLVGSGGIIRSAPMPLSPLSSTTRSRAESGTGRLSSYTVATSAPLSPLYSRPSDRSSCNWCFLAGGVRSEISADGGAVGGRRHPYQQESCSLGVFRRAWRCCGRASARVYAARRSPKRAQRRCVAVSPLSSVADMASHPGSRRAVSSSTSWSSPGSAFMRDFSAVDRRSVAAKKGDSHTGEA